jgi:pimeloyl-ACP methyl ester carboxylesterase
MIAIGASPRLADLGFLAGCDKPVLFIQGERDSITPLAALEPFLRTLPASSPCQLVRIPGAGHFFDHQLDRLTQAILDYVGAK